MFGQGDVVVVGQFFVSFDIVQCFDEYFVVVVVVVFIFFDYCFVVWVVVVVDLVCVVVFVVGIDYLVVIEGEQEGMVVFDIVVVIGINVVVVVQQVFVLDYVFVLFDWGDGEYVIVMDGGFVGLDFFWYWYGLFVVNGIGIFVYFG